MSDQKQVLTKISWQEVFGFTKLFKGFALAARRGMLTLGVVMLLMIFLGGWAMDMIWSMWDSTMVPTEIMLRARNRTDYEKMMDNIDDSRLKLAARLLENSQVEANSLTSYLAAIDSNMDLRSAFNDKLYSINSNEPADAGGRLSYQSIYDTAREKDKSYESLVKKVALQNEREIDKIEKILDDLDKQATKTIKATPNLSKQAKEERLDALERAYQIARKAVTVRKIQQRDMIVRITGVGIFEGFIAFERDCIYNGVMAIRNLNFTGGLAEYSRFKSAGQFVKDPEVQPVTGLVDPSTLRPKGGDAPGLAFFVLMALEGVIWLIATHPVYAAIFLLWCLICWSLFGGAMYRMAAVRFARWQTIGIFEALGFSGKRIITFFAAPIIPLAVIAGLGLLISVLSLLGNIPFAGPFVLGLIFWIFVIIGAVMSGILIFYIGNIWMKYPVIAATGCDACGGISDSYSYLFQRPFRIIFYGIVASIYGMITYLFVRFFVFLALSLVHMFVKLGIFTGGSSLGRGADALDVLWVRPEFWNLHSFNFMAAGPWDSICAVLIALSIWLAAATVAAYLVSYFISASTIAYFLIRNSCDSTDFDDVYIEGEDEAMLDIEFASKPQDVPADQPESAAEEEAKEDESSTPEQEDSQE